MGADVESMGMLRRLFSISLLNPLQWDRNKYVRGALVLAMTVCIIGAPIDWRNWAKGSVPIIFPVLLTSGALAVLIAVPRKWDLITLSFGMIFVLSIIGTLLRRAPLDVGLALVFASGVLYFGCVYLGERAKGQRNADRTHGPR